eukprot:GEMP01005635.1.p1 GENE.GEMP01005635.1~~GEMP01005635.1.p1  ORF type:complete len:783 (+),score=141.55 GEMP01005635.1:148-2496(+)
MSAPQVSRIHICVLITCIILIITSLLFVPIWPTDESAARECTNSDEEGTHGAAKRLYDYGEPHLDASVSESTRCAICQAFVKYKFSPHGPCRRESSTTIHGDTNAQQASDRIVVRDSPGSIQQRALGFSKCDVNHFVDCQALCEFGAGNFTDTTSCEDSYAYDVVDRFLGRKKIKDMFSTPYKRVCAALFTRLGTWGSVVRAVRQQRYGHEHSLTDDETSAICRQHLDSCAAHALDTTPHPPPSSTISESPHVASVLFVTDLACDAGPPSSNSSVHGGDHVFIQSHNVNASSHQQTDVHDELSGANEISFPDETNMKISTIAVTHPENAIHTLDARADALLATVIPHRFSTDNFITHVKNDRTLLDNLLVLSGIVLLRPLNRELTHKVLTTRNRHEHQTLLVEVSDPVVRETLLKLYGALSWEKSLWNTYHCLPYQIHQDSLLGHIARRKLVTSSMLAGLKWDTPNDAELRKQITQYVRDYKPAMWEYIGVDQSKADYVRAYNNPTGERFARLVDHLVTTFVTYNQFFYRKLKPHTRNCLCYGTCGKTDCNNAWGRDAIAQQWFGSSFSLQEHAMNGRPRNVVLSPSDCRLMVFETLDSVNTFWIKGNKFTLDTLAPGIFVRGVPASSAFAHGSFMIARLAPQDYHRFHWPVGGTIGNTTFHHGQLFSVNPLAVRSLHRYRHNDADALVTNKRLSTTLISEPFGSVLYSAIGATLIGSLILTTGDGQHVVSGEEHGYMAHGGSTVAIFFEKSITWRKEILENSKMGFETVLRVGEPVGALLS